MAIKRSIHQRGSSLVAFATAFSMSLPMSSAQAQGQPTTIRRQFGVPTVSVPEFKNNVTGAWWWQGPVAQDLSHALANELAATGEIKVVERRNLNQVLSEQELAELGIVRKGSASSASKGQMTGARYIILGTITSYESATNVESQGSGLSFLGFGGSQQNIITKDYVAIDVRVVDSTTGEVVGSRTVEGRAANTVEQKKKGGSLLPIAGIVAGFVPMGNAGYAATAAAATFSYSNNSTTENRTPAAKAIRAAMIEATGYISCLLVPKGDCMTAYMNKDQERREKTLGTLKLD